MYNSTINISILMIYNHLTELKANMYKQACLHKVTVSIIALTLHVSYSLPGGSPGMMHQLLCMLFR